MIKVVKLPGFDRRDHLISDVIEEFGAWIVLVAVMKEICWRKRSRDIIEPSNLTTHQRRDVGLPSERVESQNWDLG